MRDLGTLSNDGNSSAYGINELGQVVGYTDTSTGRASYLYTDGNMVLLDTLIDPASGWTIADANAINDLGQIAGRACKGELCYAVRLDPAQAVPEPQQLFLLGAGIVMLVLGQAGGNNPRQNKHPRTRRGWRHVGSLRSAQTV